MDTNRCLFSWMFCLAVVAMTTAEPDPLRRHFGDETRRRRLNVVTIQSDPYIRLNWSPGLIGNERYEGYYPDLMSRLADLAGFDYQLHLVGDGKLGHRGDEGAWTGMVGELLARTADLTLGPLSATRERQDVVDFTSPIAEVKLGVIMAKVKDTGGAEKGSSAAGGSQSSYLTTLPALLARSDLKFSALRNSDAVQALMTSLDSNARSLYRRLQEQPMTSLMGNMYEALEFVRRSGYALVLDLPTAEYYIGREPCDLALVATFLEGRTYALATRKGDPLLGEMNRALETLKGQRSLWQRMRSTWWEPQCPGVTVEGAAGVEEGKSKDTDSLVGDPSTSTSAMLHLKVTTELSPPFVIRSPDGALSGYTMELLENIARLVPFRYDVTFSQENAGFGKRKRNEWSGMAGELVRGEVDLAVAPFTSHRQRDRVLSYTKPFLHSTLSLLIRTSTVTDDLPIFFMEDLLNQTEYTYGVQRGSHLEKDLKLSEEHVVSEIWTNIMKDKRRNVVRTLEDGIRKVRQERFAFIIPSTYATYLSSQPPCDLMALDQFMFITNYMFAVKKGNELVDRIDEALIKLQQDGVLQMLFHKWWNSGDCVGATDPPKPVTNIVNVTAYPAGRKSSGDWVHGLFTFSTRWRNPVTPSTTGPPTSPTTTSHPTRHNPVTSAGNAERAFPSPVTSPNQTEADDVMRNPLTKTPLTERGVTYTVPTTLPTVGGASAGRSENTSNRPHRHRHRHRPRDRKRNRERKRERNRNRKNHSPSPNITTIANATDAMLPEHANEEDKLLVPGNTEWLITSTTAVTPSTRAGPPPSPPRWDGKYVFEDDLLSTRTPENYTIDLEFIPAEEDSIRIFPFTYKPRSESRPPEVEAPEPEVEAPGPEVDVSEPEVDAVPATVLPATAPPGVVEDTGNERATTPSDVFPGGSSTSSTWRNNVRETEANDKTDRLYPATTPPIGETRGEQETSGGSEGSVPSLPSLFIPLLIVVGTLWVSECRLS